MQTVLSTPGEVIRALGGPVLAARRLGLRRTQVGNWQSPKRNRIPPDYLYTVQAALAEIGLHAAPQVFKMRPVSATGGRRRRINGA